MIMKLPNNKLLPALCLLTLIIGTTRVLAQGGGGGGGGGGNAAQPDINTVYEKILTAERTAMSVTNEDEWQVIAPKLLKVVQLKMAEHTMSVRLLFASAFPRGGGVVTRGGRGARTPVETLALTGMIPAATEGDVDVLMARAMSETSKSADITAAMNKLRDVRKKRKTDLEAAQSDLRDLLSHRQESILVARGILGLATDDGMADPSGGMLVNMGPALQRIMATNRVLLNLTNNDDWSAISPRMQRVLQLKMDAYGVQINTLFLLNNVRVITTLPAGRPDVSLELGAKALTGELPVSLDPAEHSLLNAVETRAPIEAINAAEANAKMSREQRHADLAKAEADLREIMTPRQEAVLLGLGLLD
jgi:hypothetical protein